MFGFVYLFKLRDIYIYTLNRLKLQVMCFLPVYIQFFSLFKSKNITNYIQIFTYIFFDLFDSFKQSLCVGVRELIANKYYILIRIMQIHMFK